MRCLSRENSPRLSGAEPSVLALPAARFSFTLARSAASRSLSMVHVEQFQRDVGDPVPEPPLQAVRHHKRDAALLTGRHRHAMCDGPCARPRSGPEHLVAERAKSSSHAPADPGGRRYRAAGRCSGSAGRPVWLTVRQPLLYQGRRCLLRICGRKTLPAPSLVAGPRRVGGAGVGQAAAQ